MIFFLAKTIVMQNVVYAVGSTKWPNTEIDQFLLNKEQQGQQKDLPRVAFIKKHIFSCFVWCARVWNKVYFHLKFKLFWAGDCSSADTFYGKISSQTWLKIFHSRVYTIKDVFLYKAQTIPSLRMQHHPPLSPFFFMRYEMVLHPLLVHNNCVLYHLSWQVFFEM